MKSRYRSLFRLILIAVTLIFLTTVFYDDLLYWYYRNFTKPKYLPFVAFYPYSCNHMNSLNRAEFLSDLQIAEDLGFKGVMIFNTECFYDDGNLKWALDHIEDMGLKFMIQIQYFNRSHSFPFVSSTYSQEGFMTNERDFSQFCEFVYNVSLICRDYENNSGYVIYYPFDSSTEESKREWINHIKTEAYHDNLQSVIDSILEADQKPPIFLCAGLYEEDPTLIYDILPKNFDGISGFAYMPYTTKKDKIQREIILKLRDYWENYSRNYGGSTIIGEWGVCTQGVYSHGKATDESAKRKMIEEFFDFIYTWETSVVYFGLRDFPPEKADFGLIYDNGTLKISGKAVKDILKKLDG